MWHRVKKTTASGSRQDVGWMWIEPMFAFRLKTRLDHPPPPAFSGRVFTTAYPGFSPIDTTLSWGYGWAHLSQPDMAAPNTAWWLGPRGEQQELALWLARAGGLDKRTYDIEPY